MCAVVVTDFHDEEVLTKVKGIPRTKAEPEIKIT